MFLDYRASRTVAMGACWISVVMAPSASTMEAGLSTLVCYNDGDADVQEPNVEEPSEE
jgi:hypothetical protein